MSENKQVPLEPTAEMINAMNQVMFRGGTYTQMFKAAVAAAPDQPSSDSIQNQACSKCGQIDGGQTGEYPCTNCGLPILHDEPSAESDKYLIDSSPLVLQLVAALEGVVKVADRKTVEFDAARTALANAKSQLFAPNVLKTPNSGHGHVYPRPDGVRARCGGPGVCAYCSIDAKHKVDQEAK